MRAQQRAISGEAPDPVLGGDGASRAQLLFRAPEVEVLHGALGEVLALGDGLGLRVAFHHDRADAALAQFDGQPHPDGAAADDHDLGILVPGAASLFLALGGSVRWDGRAQVV